MSPVLAQPFLLGTSCAGLITSLEALQMLLERSYGLQDLELLKPKLQAKAGLRVQAAAVQVGEVRILSVFGSPLTLAVQPKHPFCSLALPSHGWGRYVMDGHRIDNTVGQTVAFLPPRPWQLTNNQTGGTAIQFTEQALLGRWAAMAGDLELPQVAAQLSRPFTVNTDQPRAQQAYRHLLGALAMVDHCYRLGLGEPEPMLRLDDLILRCAAALLFPRLLEGGPGAEQDPPLRDIRTTVHGVMEWMNAHLHEPISLSDIERQSGYGRRAIQMGFKADVGCGPMQWLRRQRLLLAFLQLQDPEPGLTVTQVAQACGYLSLASFSRDFRSRFGLAASELLQRARSTP